MSNPYRDCLAELYDWAKRTSSHYYFAPDVLDRARVLLDQPGPEGVTDEELLDLMPQQFRDDMATVCRMAAHGAGPDVKPGLFRVSLNTGVLDFARAVEAAVLARRQPEPPADGEVADEALAAFAAWFCQNYPGPDTIIHKPEWHAPKVFRAAAHAIALPTPEAADARQLTLVERVTRRLAGCASEGRPGDDATPIAGAVICEVAEWLAQNGKGEAADLLDDDTWQELCIAAALRALADNVEYVIDPQTMGEVAVVRVDDVMARVAELEGS